MEEHSEQAPLLWYYARGDQKIGPLSTAQIASLVSKGGLPDATLVWRSGLSGWVPLVETELARYLPGVPGVSPTPVAASAPPPAASAVPPPASQPQAKEVPPGVKGWCWGAFLLNWIWAIRFRYWWGLLSLIPWLGFGMIVYQGIKGRELAWQRGSWDSVESFRQVQRRWSVAGTAIALLVAVVALGIGAYGYLDDRNSSSHEAALEELRRAIEAPVALPTPSGGLRSPETPPAASSAAGQFPVRITLDGEQYQAAGGTLKIEDDPNGGRQLLFNGQALPKFGADHIRLVAVYRYADWEAVLVTYFCGGSSCSYTSFGFVEVSNDRQLNAMTNDQLTMLRDGSVPDVAIQADGSLLIRFEGFDGPAQWRYAKGQVVKQ